MARLSKTQHFSVYEDGRPSAATSLQRDSSEPPIKRRCVTIGSEPFKEDTQGQPFEGEEAEVQALDITAQLAEDICLDERRESILTATSISTLPEYYTEEHGVIHTPYALAAPILRPRFRRPDSVLRMQMSSPSPPEPCSPRSSTSSSSLAGAGALQIVRAPRPNESPRARRKRLDKQHEEREEQEHRFPLILLHATLLPVNLPWSTQSMQDLLPPETLKNLQLLRSKISDTVLHRGILIPHPREEYDMLEERLLEAMELQDERLTKCGHFTKRLSEESTSTTISNDQDGDSGVGSSLDGSDGELCAICRHHIKTSVVAVGSGSKEWSVKVYAANGLMRASAWAAAWSEMERVDVEIQPWISEDLRRQLDEMKEHEEVEEREGLEDEEARIREIVEEQVRLAHEEHKRLEEFQKNLRREKSAGQHVTAEEAIRLPKPTARPPSGNLETLSQSTSTELPKIYRPSQIPMSVLLKNYLCLLARDRRNVAMLVVILVAVFFTMRSPAATRQAVSRSFEEDCSRCQQSGPFPVQSPDVLEVEAAHEQAAWLPIADVGKDVTDSSTRELSSEQTQDETCAQDSVLFDIADE